MFINVSKNSKIYISLLSIRIMLRKHTKSILLVFICLLVFGILYALKNTSYFLRSCTFIFAILAFFSADYLFKLDFKNMHYILFFAISFFGIMLSPLFYISTYYDKILHLLSPILLSILTFHLVDRIEGITFQMKLFITFSVLISLITLFEIGEFTLDKLFDLKLQGVYLRDISGVNKLNLIMDRNDDTMIDLILGITSGIIFTISKSLIFVDKKILKKINKK
jgi:hypothetical protein